MGKKDSAKPSRQSKKSRQTTPDDIAIFDKALRSATKLAKKGPLTGGNPRVGCALVKDGKIIAVGYHRGAGTPHAEVDALAQAGSDAAGATAVVTLEPCNHTGKTPPCTQALIQAGVSRVIYAADEPTPVAGGGRKALTEAGIEVASAHQFGISEKTVAKALDLTTQWRLTVTRQRPWLIAKTAMTLDGRVAAADGTSQWITGEKAREHAHRKLRATVDAIAVGTGTALADNPELTVRLLDLPADFTQPLPVVLGHSHLPDSLKLKQRGALQIRTHDLREALEILWQQGIHRVLLEGGPRMVSAAITAGLVDEWWCYVAPVVVGNGTPAVTNLGVSTLNQARAFKFVGSKRLGEDVALHLVNENYREAK